MGGIDLVRALGLAGIRSVVVGEPDSPARWSRFASEAVDQPDSRSEPEGLLELLLTLGAREAQPPILYYDGDFELLFVSRFREQLRERFRFVVPARDLVEDLVDKVRFSRLAAAHDLPVPATRVLSTTTPPPELDLGFPVIVKQATRDGHLWDPLAAAKVVEIQAQDELRARWPRFAALGAELIAQELIPGAETGVESYHAYVDEHGRVRGEFTGKKIRTYPPAYGYSTALTTTDARDVAELGRDLSARLGLRGVAKFDFKRGPDGALHLLEINPRFNLWHHVGAKAGVNLPWLVYGDLTGAPTSAAGPARAGVRWISPRDMQAARAARVPLGRWARWAVSVEAKSLGAADDPMPLVASVTQRAAGVVRSRISERTAARRRGDR
jgi:predicted ATP-grasp superfamily ATP-dependent carboligase